MYKSHVTKTMRYIINGIKPIPATAFVIPLCIHIHSQAEPINRNDDSIFLSIVKRPLFKFRDII